MSRTLNVVRMQLVNSQTYIWIPLIILGGSLLVSLAIYGILDSSGIESPKYGGGAQAPLWYFLAVGVQALTLTFPFSQAMSVTRREFYLGTLLTAAMTAAILSIVFVIGGFIERFTNGWASTGTSSTSTGSGRADRSARCCSTSRSRCSASWPGSGRRRSTSGSDRHG